jgi:hypothetical protein
VGRSVIRVAADQLRTRPILTDIVMKSNLSDRRAIWR